MTDDTPERIGAYDVVATIGRGTMGTVYKAIQADPIRVVAIKVLPPKFRSEVHTVAILNHPNVVQIIDKGKDGEPAYFVMEFVDGTSLDAMLRHRRLSLQEALKVMHGICLGLQAAHESGVVHRDLSPRSILVNSSLSVVKLADFGMSRVEAEARALGGTLSTLGMSVRHFQYRAPEQRKDPTNVDRRADVYSAGAVFYEMLTGRLPTDKTSLPSELNSELPSDVDPIVLKCLHEDPEKRYPTIAKLREDVDRLEERMRFQLVDELRGLHRSTAKFFDRSSRSRFGRGGVGIKVAGGVLIAVAAGVIYLLVSRPASQPSAPAAPSTTAETPTPAGTPAPVAPEAASSAASAATTAPAVPVPAPPAASASPTASPAPVKAPVDSGVPKTPAPTPAATVEAKSPEKPTAADMRKDLDVAKSKIDAKLYDQALADLASIIGRNPDPEIALDAQYELARAQVGKGQTKEALATYVGIEARFKGMPRSAEAWYDHAQLLQGNGKDKNAAEDARKIYGQLAQAFPKSSWAAKGLVAKADLEKHFKLSQLDPRLNINVPAALVSLRELTETHPTDRAAESAFWQLGQMLDDVKQYELAAEAYVALATNFPATGFDAWYEAAQLFEKRLKAPAKAKAAYLKVPAGSENYKDARKRADSIKG